MTDILGSNLSRLGFDEALAACDARIEDGRGGFVVFANVHTVTEAVSSEALRSAFRDAALVVADGLPLVWSSRLLGDPIHGRVCGPDFMAAYLQRRRHVVHGFVGGRPGQADRIAERFGVRTVSHSPPVRAFHPHHVADDIAELRRAAEGRVPSIVWVGLGAPKQELWMHEAAQLLPKTLFFGVGAAFDFLSGTKPRAPRWMQKSGLEWLFRLGSEPRRLASRYITTNSRFLYLLGRQLTGRPASHPKQNT